MPKQSHIVGIAGGSASGKTTLARALAQFLEAQTPPQRVGLLSADTFFLTDKTQGPFFTSPSTGQKQFNFNHPDAIDQAQLLNSIQSRSQAENAPDVLLVEGLMVLQIPAIRELLDVRIFVELEADVRALRRLLRDIQGGRASTDPQFIATYYLESARVGHEKFVEPSRIHADFIVRGDANFSRIIPMISSVLTTD